VLVSGLVALLFGLIIGGYFLATKTMALLPLILLAAMLVITYTTWLNRQPILCLLSPGLGFGLLMVAGSAWAVSGKNVPLSWWVSLIPFFAISNLLLLNQYPDLDADQAIGRKTVPVVWGVKRATLLFGATILLNIFTVITLTVVNVLPTTALLTLAPIAISLASLKGALTYGKDIGDFPVYLGLNVAAANLAPLTLAIVLLLS
jgi:1,4-dihydroxy-2-naphthoate octaprenyltransferase